MEFRPLSGDEFDEAVVRREDDVLKRAGAVSALADTFPQVVVNPEDARMRQTADLSLDGCHKGTLIAYGLCAWGGGMYDGVPCEPEAKRMLDARTRDWAAQQVFALSYITSGEGPASEASIAASISQDGASEA
jgi:hypothetical protein